MITDLLQQRGFREDDEQLTAEVGALIKCDGHGNKKGLIVAPDVAKMNSRSDDVSLIKHWCVLLEEIEARFAHSYAPIAATEFFNPGESVGFANGLGVVWVDSGCRVEAGLVLA